MVKDVNPQFWRHVITMSGANTFTQANKPTPVLPAALPGGKILVMECFKVFIDFRIDTLAEDAFAQCHIASRSHSAVKPINGEGILGSYFWEGQMITEGAVGKEGPKEYDLTDGDGNGYLVASDTLYVAALTGGQAAPAIAYFAILYKLKSITATEYIGIVASG